MQSTIPNPQSSIRHNPTESYKIQQKFVRAHARNSPKNATTVRRVHPPTSFPHRRESTPTPIIPHSQTTSFPHPFRHSREGGNPALPNQQSTICNQQSAINNSPPPTSFPHPFRHSREGGNPFSTARVAPRPQRIRRTAWSCRPEPSSQ